MTHLRFVSSLMICATLLSFGCAKKTAARAAAAPSFDTVPAPPPLASAPVPAAAAPDGAPLTEDELFARKSLEQLNAERPLGDVLFALDQAEIDGAGRATLQKNAEWLARWRSTRIIIEGHCDERGTSEYNLALGERRAHAVRNYLVSLGIETDRLEMVSKGKEVPVCEERDERCWRLNRRAHPIITVK